MIFQSLPTSHSFRALPGPTTRRPNLARPIATVVFIFCFFFTLSFLKTSTPASTSALSTDGFKAGNIMNDYTMGNYTTMSEADIQAWLTQKNPCNNTNYATYQQLTNKYKDRDPSVYSWHWQPDDPKKPEKGHFVCLSEETFGEGKEIAPAEGGETAARIIYQAAQDYKINPQVFLVLLQKEMSLITDDIPRSGQYNSATGYGCTDSAPCFSQYAGFKNQIRGAAYLFRMSLDGKSSMYPIGKNYVQYNKDKSCGGSEIIIENYATSALYRYTPYQPNAAALAAGTGKGNACSAYGNRNFYIYFTQWFGSTQTVSPLAAPVQDPATSDANTDAEPSAPTIKWQPLDTPRYLQPLKTSAIVYDITTEQATAERLKGKAFFTEKIFLVNGDMCLRTAEMPENHCVLYSQLTEAKWQTYPLERPRNFVINTEAYSINPSTGKSTAKLTLYKQYHYDKKLLLPSGEWCLINKDASTCTPLSQLTELDQGWLMMETPRQMSLKSSGYKLDRQSGQLNKDIHLYKGMIRKYVSKSLLSDGVWCLRTEYDHDLNTNNCIRLTNLDDI